MGFETELEYHKNCLSPGNTFGRICWSQNGGSGTSPRCISASSWPIAMQMIQVQSKKGARFFSCAVNLPSVRMRRSREDNHFVKVVWSAFTGVYWSLFSTLQCGHTQSSRKAKSIQ